MKRLSTMTLCYMLLLVIGPASEAYAQSSRQVAQVKNYFKGGYFLVSYRDGEVLTGTQYFEEYYFCSSGAYQMAGKSIKGNVFASDVVRNWEDQGRWDVFPYKGETVMQLRPTYGQKQEVAVRLTSNGGILLGNGAKIERLGRAPC